CSCCCFFFSSRRRHTRFSRDWSSDVCSSDLLPTPAGVDLVPVSTARDMREAMLDAAKEADVVVMAAAVADFRPAEFVHHKIKKTGDRPAPIELETNPDVLAELVSTRRPEQIIVGFAAETGDDTADVLEHA